MNDQKPFHPFTLNFLLDKDAASYFKVISQNRKGFLGLLLLTFFFLFMSLSGFQYDIYTKSKHYYFLFAYFVFFLLSFFCFKLTKKDWAFDILLALLISAINMTFLEYIQFYLKKIDDKSFENLLVWISIFIGIHINIMSSFMIFAKIRWYIISIANVAISLTIWRHFILIYKLNAPEGIIITLISPSFFLQILINYLHEKQTKQLFINLRESSTINEKTDFFPEFVRNEIPFVVIILNGGKVGMLHCNAKGHKLFHGIEQNDLIPKLNQIRINGEPNVSLMDIYQNALTYDNEFDDLYSDCSYQDIDKKKHFFDLYFKSILWRHKKLISLILCDVSLKYSGEKENNHYKNILLPTISHNLKTPVHSISGFLELASEKLKNNVCLEYIEAAQCSCKHLLQLINDVLDVSKLVSSTLKLKFEYFYILKPIQEILEVFEIQIKKKNLVFECFFLSNIEIIQIYADPFRFKQILYNLLSNALKYTFKGKISLFISNENCEVNGHTHKIVTFKIKDTGIGMSTNKMTEIFKIYKKIDDSAIINKECLGFGLSISQYLARILHPDGITVISALNKGSEFKFSIPIYEEKSGLNDSISSMDEHPDFQSLKVYEYKNNDSHKFLTKQSTTAELHLSVCDKKANVLLVDDDVLNNLIHSKYLESLGFEYEIALNGREAIDKIMENAKANKFFSIILLDCNMPVLNGFETAKEINWLIRKHFLPYVPIIAVTANATINDYDDCKKAGMEFYLSKPVSKIGFNEKMMEALSFLKAKSFTV